MAHGLGVLIQEGGDPLMDSPALATTDAQNEQQAALMAHAAAQARGAI